MKNLKKFFDPKRIEDLKVVRKQSDILADRGRLQCQQLLKSIDARAAIISHMLLAKSNKKDDLAAPIEALKEKVNNYIKVL